jgi:hypothetical protein
VSGGRGIAAAAVVLSTFSQIMLWKLGWPGNGEVVLSGGAPIAGCGGQHWHGARRGRGGA